MMTTTQLPLCNLFVQIDLLYDKSNRTITADILQQQRSRYKKSVITM